MKHRWDLTATPLRDTRSWRCKRCGCKRIRVVPVATAAFPMVVRSFWLYMRKGSGFWSNRGGVACFKGIAS